MPRVYTKLFASLALFLLMFSCGAMAAPTGTLWVYVGTYTGPQSKGIYVMKMDPATGKLSDPTVAAEVGSPSFVTIDPTQTRLYSVSEFSGNQTGRVSAFSIAPQTGLLTLLNEQTTGGKGACFVGLDHTGKVAMVTNYGSGSFETLPVGDDGKLGEPVSFIQDAGDPNALHKQSPHAHSINVDPTNHYAFAADLGVDKLFCYRLELSTAKLTPNDPPFIKLPAGAGPRHFTFHPSGKFAYLINELNSTITAFTFDPTNGSLNEIQTISTLPADYDGKNSTAEVQVHPSGKFLYGSNRGNNSIAIFTVDEQTGKLTAAGHQPSGGKTPRNFRMDPSGNFMLVAHQDSDSVVAFKIDSNTGGLTPTGQTVTISKPVCVKFVSVP